MSRIVSLQPKGLDFTRLAIAAAIGEDRRDYAVARWGEDSLAARVAAVGGVEMLAHEKATVAAGGTVSGNWAALLSSAESAATEFFGVVRERSLVGRIAGFRNIPLRTRIILATSGFSAAWIGQGQPKPIGSTSFTEDNLPSRKLAAMCVVTNELIERADTGAEVMIRNDLADSIAAAIDLSFIDPANAGTADVEPASVTNGSPTVASTGDGLQDIRNLIQAFPGDIGRAVLVGSPETFAAMHDPNVLPGLGVRGGNAIGIPAFASSSAGDTLALIDPDGIAMGMGTPDIRVATQATIEMKDSDLTQDGSSGTGTAMVSLFQCNCVAMLAEQFINWKQARPSVSYISGVAQS